MTEPDEGVQEPEASGFVLSTPLIGGQELQLLQNEGAVAAGKRGGVQLPKGPFAAVYATAPTFPKAGVALPPLDRMSFLCRRAGGWQQQPHAPQPGRGPGQQRYLLSSALLAISSAVTLARAAAGTRSASYSAGDRTGRMLRKRTSLGSPFQLGQFCPCSLEETWAGQGRGTEPGQELRPLRDCGTTTAHFCKAGLTNIPCGMLPTRRQSILLSIGKRQDMGLAGPKTSRQHYLAPSSCLVRGKGSTYSHMPDGFIKT